MKENKNGRVYHEWPLIPPDDAVYFIDKMYETYKPIPEKWKNKLMEIVNG